MCCIFYYCHLMLVIRKGSFQERPVFNRKNYLAHSCARIGCSRQSVIEDLSQGLINSVSQSITNTRPSVQRITKCYP